MSEWKWKQTLGRVLMTSIGRYIQCSRTNIFCIIISILLYMISILFYIYIIIKS